MSTSFGPDAGLFKEITEAAKAMEPELVRILSDLVRAKSLSRQEADVVSVIRREMESIGLDEVIVDGLGSLSPKEKVGNRSTDR